VKANISLDAGLLEAIDEEAERRGITRSGFLASAARYQIVGNLKLTEFEEVTGRDLWSRGEIADETLRSLYGRQQPKQGSYERSTTVKKSPAARGATRKRGRSAESKSRAD
jgi:Ribbon-helix-helix protein, copG family